MIGHGAVRIVHLRDFCSLLFMCILWVDILSKNKEALAFNRYKTIVLPRKTYKISNRYIGIPH